MSSHRHQSGNEYGDACDRKDQSAPDGTPRAGNIGYFEHGARSGPHLLRRGRRRTRQTEPGGASANAAGKAGHGVDRTGASDAHVREVLLGIRQHRGAGAADPGCLLRPSPLPQRPRHAAHAPGVGRDPRHQRKRHGCGRRTQVRRQRHALGHGRIARRCGCDADPFGYRRAVRR